MFRKLLPSVEHGRWSGAALTRVPPDPRQWQDVHGGCLYIQWLGFMIEIGVGRVR